MKFKKILNLVLIFSIGYQSNIASLYQKTGNSTNNNAIIIPAVVTGVSALAAGIIGVIAVLILKKSNPRLTSWVNYDYIKHLNNIIIKALGNKELTSAIETFDTNNPKTSMEKVFNAIRNALDNPDLKTLFDKYKEIFFQEWDESTQKLIQSSQDAAAQTLTTNDASLEALSKINLDDLKTKEIFDKLKENNLGGNVKQLKEQFESLIKESIKKTIPERVFLEKIFSTIYSTAEEATFDIRDQAENYNIDPDKAGGATYLLTTDLVQTFTDSLQKNDVFSGRLFAKFQSTSLAKELQETANLRSQWNLTQKFLEENPQIKADVKKILSSSDFSMAKVQNFFSTKYFNEINQFVTNDNNLNYIKSEIAKSYALGIIGEAIEKNYTIPKDPSYEQNLEEIYEKILQKTQNITLDNQTVDQLIQNIKKIHEDLGTRTFTTSEFYNQLLEGIDKQELFNKFSDVLRDYGITEYKFDIFEPRAPKGPEPGTGREPNPTPEPEPGTGEPGGEEPYNTIDFLKEFEGF